MHYQFMYRTYPLSLGLYNTPLSVFHLSLPYTHFPTLPKYPKTKMSEQEGPVTAYTWQISAQDQQGGPGLDKDMKEQANWTQLEFWDDNGKPYLKEYEGRGLLQDKAVLITGGDSGIGRSVAILMAREGADVSILYLPEEEEDAQWTIKQIEKAGRKGHGMQYDLKEVANCKAAIEEHMKVFGKLNVLVNNASMQESCEDHREIDMDVVQKTFQTNIIQVCDWPHALPSSG
jgi:hypothetical protein